MIDESYQNVARWADWIKLCYLNQQSGQTFITPIVTPGILNATIYNLSTSAIISGATVQMTSGGSQSQATNSSGIANFSSIPAGSYVFSVTAPGYFSDTGLVTITAGQTTNVGWYLIPIPHLPSQPLLHQPTAHLMYRFAYALSWNSAANASSYRLQVSLSSSFATIVYDQSGLSATQATISGLPNNTIVYWHVNAANSNGTSVWSPTWSFTTIPTPPSAPNLFSPTNSATGISLTPSFPGVHQAVPLRIRYRFPYH